MLKIHIARRAGQALVTASGIAISRQQVAKRGLIRELRRHALVYAATRKEHQAEVSQRMQQQYWHNDGLRTQLVPPRQRMFMRPSLR
jgi:hypothetical protein